MCGLVGVIGKDLNEAAKKAFYTLLYLDVLRGEDSTGVAAISKAFEDKTEIQLFKSLGGTSELFYQHNIWKKGRALTYKAVDVFIGHNRFATQGKIIEENAHPFEFDNLVGAHNGTVNLPSIKDFNGYAEFDIDSKIIYSHLSHTQSIRDVWKDADGALALSWYDKQRKQVNLIRNKQRPIFFVYSKQDKEVFWASESWMLTVALGRENIEHLGIVECEPNKLYSFELDDAKKVFHREELLPPFVEKPQKTYYMRGENYYDDWYTPQNHKTYNPPEKRDKSTNLFNNKKGANLIVTEFHNIPSKPLAFGVTQDGSPIRIVIPVNKYSDARKRLADAPENGFFYASKVFKTVLKNGEYWCNWIDLQFHKLKPDVKILKSSDGSFKVTKQVNDVKNLSAPWFNPDLRLTLDAYASKTQKGCDCCKEKPVWADRHDLLWADAETFYCKDCKDTDLVKNTINV